MHRHLTRNRPNYGNHTKGEPNTDRSTPESQRAQTSDDVESTQPQPTTRTPEPPTSITIYQYSAIIVPVRLSFFFLSCDEPDSNDRRTTALQANRPPHRDTQRRHTQQHNPQQRQQAARQRPPDSPPDHAVQGRASRESANALHRPHPPHPRQQTTKPAAQPRQALTATHRLRHPSRRHAEHAQTRRSDERQRG